MNEDKKNLISPRDKESFRKFVEQTTGWRVKDTNIKKISVRTFSNRIKKQITSEICVGQELDFNLSNIPHEPVMAIFESNDYLVVTPENNKQRTNTTVYLFGQSEVLSIERTV